MPAIAQASNDNIQGLKQKKYMSAQAKEITSE